MLRIIQNRSSESAKSYYAQSDYLSEGQELTGYWGGKAAERLGLSGEVGKQHFDRMCGNLHPQTGDRLTLRTKADRTPGYDFNFHVPKGVSLAYAMGQDDRILDLFRASVEETMQEIEREAKTRVRKHGADENRTTGNLVWATFIHTTARPIDGVPDPLLHAHAFTFNTTWDDKEHAWKAAQFRDLKRDAPYFEAAFRARMARGMKGLGYGIRREGKTWDIDGIPKELNRKFSRRTDQIEQLAEKLGITNPKAIAELAATTRESKLANMCMSELRAVWNERLTQEEQWLLHDVRAGATPKTLGPTVSREHESMEWAKLHSFERHSVVPTKQLLAEALRHGVGDVTVQGVHDQLERQRVIVQSCDGQSLATTPEMLVEERAMMAFAKSGVGQVRPLNDHWHVRRDWLNDDQKAAIAHVLTSSDRVVMIRGGAGTGKTKLMEETIEGIESTGRKVYTFAPSSEASRDVLAGQGFKADTVQALLHSVAKQSEVAGGVIWIDEAGLLGTRTLKQVFDVASAVDARVILSGDWKQHGAVEAGAAMRMLEQEAGIKPALVNTIIRQSGEYREAVKHLAVGNTEEGLTKLHDMGWVKEITDSDERYKTLARDMVDAMLHGEKVLSLAPTHAEGELITENVRTLLKEREVLKGEERSFEQLRSLGLTEAQKQQEVSVAQGEVLVYHKRGKGHKPGGRSDLTLGLPKDLKATAKQFDVYSRRTIKLAEGDMLRITGNGKTKDGKHDLFNGQRYSIKGFTPEGDIRLSNDWVVPKDYGFVAPGYVVTSVGAQGKTVDRVFIAESAMSYPAASREQFYVSVSRGQKSGMIYTDDYASLADAVRKSDRRMSATELVNRQRKELRTRHHKFKQLTVKPREKDNQHDKELLRG